MAKECATHQRQAELTPEEAERGEQLESLSAMKKQVGENGKNIPVGGRMAPAKARRANVTPRRGYMSCPRKCEEEKQKDEEAWRKTALGRSSKPCLKLLILGAAAFPLRALSKEVKMALTDP